LCNRLRDEGMQIVCLHAPRASLEDARETAQRAAQLGATWVVLDGYDFNVEYQRSLREQGVSALIVDDEGRAAHFDADVLLNQNVYATPQLYARNAPNTRLALGARYTLLRSEFEPWRLWRRHIPEQARRILVTTGGSDPHNAAGKILAGVQRLARPDLELTVVIGVAAAHREALEAAALACKARIVHDVRQMPELMAWAHLAITAAGSTCWEMAFMGLPALTLVIADNQEPIARCLVERKAARTLGRIEDLRPEGVASALAQLLDDRQERTTLSRAGRRLIDGRGAMRVVELMREAA
jgi:UDP-2,4-diacetamido-2,4,6-trideoxy-beta-L-altropyranose hydrolase